MTFYLDMERSSLLRERLGHRGSWSVTVIRDTEVDMMVTDHVLMPCDHHTTLTCYKTPFSFSEGSRKGVTWAFYSE
jgi:lipoate synthase